jgi:alkylation response protein AidB-like acyl-CoA dehydrogenase
MVSVCAGRFRARTRTSRIEYGVRVSAARFVESTLAFLARKWPLSRDDVSVLSTHTIFEGTSEIQQLVIARAISGMRVE